MTDKNQKSKKSNQLKYSSLGFQMAITIGLGAWLGSYLDEKNQTEKPYYTIVIILLSIAIAFYQVIKEVTALNKEDENQNKHKNEQ